MQKGELLTNKPLFATYIEVLNKTYEGQIPSTGTNKVIAALTKYCKDKKIDNDELKTINGWIKPKGSDGDVRKVARCLVWYIAKIGLEIPEIQSAEFPF